MKISRTDRRNADLIYKEIKEALRDYREDHQGDLPEKLFVSRELLLVLWKANPMREEMLIALENKALKLYDVPVSQFSGRGVEFYFAEERNTVDIEEASA